MVNNLLSSMCNGVSLLRNVRQDTVITINPVDNEEEAVIRRCHLKMHDNYVKAIRNPLDIRGWYVFLICAQFLSDGGTGAVINLFSIISATCLSLRWLPDLCPD